MSIVNWLLHANKSHPSIPITAFALMQVPRVSFIRYTSAFQKSKLESKLTFIGSEDKGKFLLSLHCIKTQITTRRKLQHNYRLSVSFCKFIASNIVSQLMRLGNFNPRHLKMYISTFSGLLVDIHVEALKAFNKICV